MPNASDFFVKLFADNTVLSLSCKNLKELNKKASMELDKIYKWLVANRLTLNVAKSKFMIITAKKAQNRKFKFKLKISGTPIERCSS